MFEVSAQRSFNDAAPPDGTFSTGTASVSCPGGTRVISGGGFVDSARAQVTGSIPDPQGWTVNASGDGTNQARITVLAWCLPKKPHKP